MCTGKKDRNEDLSRKLTKHRLTSRWGERNCQPEVEKKDDLWLSLHNGNTFVHTAERMTKSDKELLNRYGYKAVWIRGRWKGLSVEATNRLVKAKEWQYTDRKISSNYLGSWCDRWTRRLGEQFTLKDTIVGTIVAELGWASVAYGRRRCLRVFFFFNTNHGVASPVWRGRRYVMFHK